MFFQVGWLRERDDDSARTQRYIVAAEKSYLRIVPWVGQKESIRSSWLNGMRTLSQSRSKSETRCQLIYILKPQTTILLLPFPSTTDLSTHIYIFPFLAAANRCSPSVHHRKAACIPTASLLWPHDLSSCRLRWRRPQICDYEKTEVLGDGAPAQPFLEICIKLYTFILIQI